MIGKHLSLRDTNRFADGTLSAQKLLRAQKHVAECRRCQEAVQFVTELHEAAGDLYQPEPPARILENILAARAEGHRAILPQAAPIRRRRRPSHAVYAFVLLGVLAVAGILLPSKEAEAGHSQLLFFPRVPVKEEVIRVQYHPGALLAGEEFVVLRGRVRNGTSPPPAFTLGEEVVVRLEIDESGFFSGTFAFPVNSVFFASVVEDRRGERIDSNGGRLWNLLRHEAQGRPTLEAYRQQFLVWQAKRFDVAQKPAEDLTEAYPDRADGWPLLLYQQQLSGSIISGVASEHKNRLTKFAAAANGDRMSASELAAISTYARRLGEDALYNEFNDVLQLRFPLHRTAVSNRMLRYRATARTDRQQHLALLEREWQLSGFSHHNLAVVGWQQARVLRDPSAMRLWTDRYLKVRPFEGAAVAIAYLTTPELRSDGMVRISREIGLLGKGAYSSFRPIEVTRHEFEHLLERRLQEVMVALGATALVTGDTARAIAILGEATGKRWAPAVFEAQARLAIALGNTARASALVARMEVDPLTEVPTDLAREIGVYRSASSRDVEVKLARIDFERMLRSEEPTPRRLPLFLVRDELGAQVELPTALEGDVSVVLLLSHSDKRALDRFGWLDAVATLETYDVRAVTIVDKESSPHLLQGLASSELAIPLLYDPTRTAAKAFGSWAIRPLFVLDAGGYIRYRAETVEDAVRHAIMIRQVTRLAA